MSKDRELAITRARTSGVEVLTVAGEIDLTNADALQQAVGDTATAAVVLDLSGVAYVDSSGIRAIDRGRRRLASEARSLVIVSPPGSPSAWTFRVAGFERELVAESVEAALASVAGRLPPA